MPEYGHLPYVMGEGNKKLSKRDPEANLLLHRERGMIPEGLLNYLGLLGWSVAADRDLFDREEMIEKFDVHDVNPNPARFDDKKAVAINAEHIRRLDAEDLRDRLLPYLKKDGLIDTESYAELDADTQAILDAAAPLVQTRIQLLGEAPALMDFLFKSADELEYQDKPVAKLRDTAPAVLDAATAAFEDVEEWTIDNIKAAVDEHVTNALEIKPRFAFQPLFVAMTGTNVSLPVVDSMAILGKDETLARLRRFRATI